MSNRLQVEKKVQSATAVPTGELYLKSARCLESSTVPPIVHEVLRSPGEMLDTETRAFFEPRFGHDFSRVRVHTDPLAVEAARALDAYAFTVGSHIAFGPEQYAPQTTPCRNLIKHELTHVLQQSLRSTPALQFVCRAPENFDFTTSRIAASIRAGLAAITVPGPTPGGAQVPRVDPGTILTILASSNCFLLAAQTIERTYFMRGGPTGGRAPLILRFHEDPAIGSHFVRESTEHRVDVEVERGVTTTAPQGLVRRIVHEIVHATRGAVTSQPRPRAGAVTIAEEAGVLDEAQTRTRENEIMTDIAATQGWTDSPTPAGVENVRSSFRSGLPMLTYQEYFIIEAMKQRNRVAGMDEAQTVTAARQMAATGGVAYVSPGSTGVFTFDPDALTRHQRTAATAPVAPLHIDEALECARLGQSRRPPANLSAGCNELLRILRGEGPLPYETAERRERMRDILMRWQTSYMSQMASYRASSAFIGWYNGLPPAVQGNARTLRFFQWALIAESMSREWQSLNRMNAETRRRHFEFLQAMMSGTGLMRGISEPPAVRR